MFPSIRTSLTVAVLLLATGMSTALAQNVNTIAGAGPAGFSGDGGPALAAEFFLPYGVAVAPDGTVFVADSANFRIRRIRPDGIIERIAGTGVYGEVAEGEGGPAVNATIADVTELAYDAPRNALYFVESSVHRVRRINLDTGIIETVGSVLSPQGIAVAPDGSVYVSETPLCRVVRLNPSDGTVTDVAGRSSDCTVGGDGGPAAAATFLFPTALATDAAGNLFVVHFEYNDSEYRGRVRRIDAATGIITTVAGGGMLPGSGPATDIALRLITGVATDVAPGGASRLFISNETQVFVVDLATGQLTVFAGVENGYYFGGDGGPAVDALFNNIGGVAFHTSALFIADANNNRIRAVTLETGVWNGDLHIINSPDAIIRVPPGIRRILGDLVISNNVAADAIDLGEVNHILGDLTTVENSVASIDFGDVETILGDLTTIENSVAEYVDADNVQTVGGNLTIIGNGPCTSVALGSLRQVVGHMFVESCGAGTFTPGPAAAGGDTSLSTRGYSTVAGTTAHGRTTVKNATAEAVMTVQLEAGSFTTPVGFSITHLEPAGLVPENGVDAAGNPVVVDPVAAYQFTFDIPTLNRDASLTFDVNLAALDDVARDALLKALDAGLATLATKGDTPGSAYQTFPVCSALDTPAPGGCVVVTLLDASGAPTTGVASVVRFGNVVGHFSTWAVVAITPPVFFNGLLQPYPAPPHAAAPVFRRGSVVPLKFTFVDADGAPIDSAAASPAVSVYQGACADDAGAAEPIAVEDAGQSGGWRYDADARTWIFGWSTKPLAAGCYWIQLTMGAPGYPAPAGMFPVVLRDR